jgi:hypothetical protein
MGKITSHECFSFTTVADMLEIKASIHRMPIAVRLNLTLPVT